MPESTWSLQDAKNQFSRVVEAARLGGPQTITRHGKPAAVVLSAAEYGRLRHLQQLRAPGFAEHLLAMPCDDGAFERLDGALRETGL